MDAGADRAGAVGKNRNIDVLGDVALDVGQQLEDAVNGVDHIGIGVLGDHQQH